ncbi:ribosome biogenesis regulatory protein homolog [Centruroides sculpturatus]|uniref:ribosome biogenesis regulatory protein homolog n=1 Tax=Centruroides sculpturatus TaxID=218467 RepID=UPI000C6D1C16|nr:ribosome biogenesis regulatory protein homolog [Centruroides sculpturatus]
MRINYLFIYIFFRNDTDNYIISLARDNTQLLINKIWELPTERYEDAVVVKLPDPTTRLPREKPLPKPKPLTKWKEYAKKKGINKRKKEKLVWDETAKEWKPRWGYKSKDNTSNDWVIEIPENADPNIDYFGKKKEEKKERKAKNEFKRLKNIARAQKFKGVGVMPSEKENKTELTKALAIAKVSTASVGKFTDALPKEKKTAKITKKRKFEPEFSDLKQERMKNLNILEGISKKQPKLDITKGVNDYLHYQIKGGKKEKGSIKKSRAKSQQKSQKRSNKGKHKKKK